MRGLRGLLSSLLRVVTFLVVLVIYLMTRIIGLVFSFPLIPDATKTSVKQRLDRIVFRVSQWLEPGDGDSISRADLIELSVRHMKSERARSAITIGGMAIGVGSIVFLVSIGYGLQDLVISRVARLEEMRQADVVPQAGSHVSITDKSLATFENIAEIEQALPLIAVVGRINYQNSVADMAVYGVTSDYLRRSAI